MDGEGEAAEDGEDDPRIAELTQRATIAETRLAEMENAEAERQRAIQEAETQKRDAAIDELEAWLNDEAAWIIGDDSEGGLLEKWVTLKKVGYSNQEAAEALSRFRPDNPFKKNVPEDVRNAAPDSRGRARGRRGRHSAEDFDALYRQKMQKLS